MKLPERHVVLKKVTPQSRLKILLKKKVAPQSRMERMVREIGARMGYDPLWELEVAALLCQLGRVVLPEEVRKASNQPSRLKPNQRKLLDTVPDVSAALIEHIPAFEAIGDIVVLS